MSCGSNVCGREAVHAAAVEREAERVDRVGAVHVRVADGERVRQRVEPEHIRVVRASYSDSAVSPSRIGIGLSNFVAM
jgi:hypothetical protein